jgi:DNA-binding winged helix-turn-helix (wHTH) protein
MRVRFGERFVADLETGELFRDGRLQRLQDKPFRLLELLLSRPSRLARYDEIECHLWPDVKVEARHGIKEAAQKVRHSLGADARRLQCLRGRGYRLMVSVLPLPEERDCALPKAAYEWGVAYTRTPLCSDDCPCDELTSQHQVP